MYQTDTKVNVNLIIADFSGIAYKTKMFTAIANQDTPVCMDCSQLTANEYVLYIMVNDKKYTEKIKIY